MKDRPYTQPPLSVRNLASHTATNVDRSDMRTSTHRRSQAQQTTPADRPTCVPKIEYSGARGQQPWTDSTSHTSTDRISSIRQRMGPYRRDSTHSSVQADSDGVANTTDDAEHVSTESSPKDVTRVRNCTPSRVCSHTEHERTQPPRPVHTVSHSGLEDVCEVVGDRVCGTGQLERKLQEMESELMRVAGERRFERLRDEEDLLPDDEKLYDYLSAHWEDSNRNAALINEFETQMRDMTAVEERIYKCIADNTRLECALRRKSDSPILRPKTAVVHDMKRRRVQSKIDLVQTITRGLMIGAGINPSDIGTTDADE
ncbi:hypothetical protein SARC_10055 [Sphaeroforma arctica JP610]|uniref:Uncharacterized protein n=1 Tax=Sphaeroforma arctica JP610 TaxID=667725 RepID=A0A0L0FL22_9EUKA|nr:hypothetical protein SARC_10055 [Sphaeroforma arctica JP610]KNC77484.1 hypothetical protein SARC_10055 [Sphaeroforma arctica JP610]|eukprot:XP_014151386.1 hypothetical protein SARC_10055 [Sphaeroforma arctica JP610]